MGVLVKDFYREIRHNLGRFLSMFFIVALGTSFFSGLRSTGYDMKYSADKYYKDQNLMDIKVIGTLGLDDYDLSDINKIDGVNRAYGGKTFDALSLINDKEYVIRTIMENRDINKAYVTEGRLPEKDNECLVDSGTLFSNGLEIGDTISLYLSGEDDIKKSLNITEFTVVGKGLLPYYTELTRDKSSIGDGSSDAFILLKEDVYELDYYTEIYVDVEGAGEYLNLSDEYLSVTDPVLTELEDISEDCAERRYKSIYDEAYEKITDGEKEIADGKIEIEDGKKKIEDAKVELKDAKEEIDKGFRELNKAESDLKKNESDLLNTKTELEENLNKLLMAEAAGMDVSIEKAQIEGALIQVAAGENEISKGKEEIEKNRQKLLDGQREYDEKSADAEVEISEAEADIKKAEEDIKEAEEKISDAKKELEDIPESKWYVLDRQMMEGIVSYDQNAVRMDSLGNVFPVLFFLVAALVCLTAMTRMVDEQRMHIGTLKALGYSGGTIAGRYISYAMLPTVFGSILGVAFGEWFFPYIISTSYGIMFKGLPFVLTPFNLKQGVLAFMAAVLSTGIATASACISQLKETPASLMRPLAPKSGKRMIFEYIPFLWKSFSFTRKATLRNLFRYKKRFIMTVIGVGGCMALLLVGFGIKDSIQVIAKEQYISLFKYEASITYNSDLDTEEKDDFAKDVLKVRGIKNADVVSYRAVDLIFDKNTREATLFIPENEENIFDFITLRDRIFGEKYEYPTEGAYISEKTANMLGVSKGDKVIVRLDDKEREVLITEIVENYIQHYIFMSKSAYESLFNEELSYNTLLVNYEEDGDFNENDFGIWVMNRDEASGISFVSDLEVNIEDMLSVLNNVIWVLILSAGLLAFIVLYNLNSINIMERRREIATLKVLGFYDSEVAMYIFRENIILTICGIILGLCMGSLLHRFVIVTVEVDLMMFGRLISVFSYIISAFVTLGFSLLVNFYMFFVLKKIDMVESLKSVE